MRRQRKPYTKTIKGFNYYRLQWTENGKRKEKLIRLPDDADSQEYDRAYWACRAGTHEAMQAPVKTSWANLIRDYRSGYAYRKLAHGTRRKYDPVIEDMLEMNGDKDVRKVKRAHIRAIHTKYADTPRAADLKVQVLRILLNHAIRELEWIERNPADGLKLYGAQKEFAPWPQEAQDAFKRAATSLDATHALTAFMLGTKTGQRPGDLVKMEWEHYDGEFIAVLQEKTDFRLWVYCPQDLREYLDALPKRGRFIMAKNLTEAIGYDALEKGFRKVRKAATACHGLVMHGWRYTAAVALAEAGCSDAEIQAVTGHKTAAMVQKYRAQAAQRKLSKQAQERRK